jgi:hypothetical protein
VDTIPSPEPPTAAYANGQEWVARTDGMLRQQRAETARLIRELRQLHDRARGPGPEEQEALLRQLAEGERERDELHAALAQSERERSEALKQAREAGERAEQLTALEADLADYRRRAEEQERVITQLRREIVRPVGPARDDADFAAYEAELAEYHRQLEADRQLLNEEIGRLRERNAQLREAAREAQENLGRERAALHLIAESDHAFEQLSHRAYERARASKDSHTTAGPLLNPRSRTDEKPAQEP